MLFISVVHILREQGQNNLLFLFSCVLGGKVGWEENKVRTKRSRRSLCIKHRDSFMKNKFAMLSDSAEGQNLGGFNLVIFLCLSTKKRLARLDKELKHWLYFSFVFLIRN